jgi:hypothetical protein
MGKLRNKDTIGVWIGVTIAAFGLVLAILPGLTGMDMMKVGFGMIFIGGFVVIMGVVTAGVYGQRAREMNRILSAENILARWVYSENQSREQIEKEYAQQTSANRSTFLIMLAWFVVIGGFFLGLDLFKEGEVNWFFAFLFFGILVLLGVVAFSAPIIWKRQAQRAARDVIIARNGVVLNGALHTWVAPLNKLTGVQFRQESGVRDLEFEIQYMARASVTNYATYTVSIPVPAGKEAEAQDVVRYFNDEA